MDISWHNTNLAFSWLDDSWAVWTNQSSSSLGVHDGLHLDHIQSWDTLGDAYYEVHLGLNCLKNGISGERWWNIDNGGIGVSGFLGLGHGGEHWEVEMLGIGLSLIDSTNNFGSVLNRLLGVESSLHKN